MKHEVLNNEALDYPHPLLPQMWDSMPYFILRTAHNAEAPIYFKSPLQSLLN